MSLVIQKFEPGGKTTQPRLYKRGNDDIDLDAYIRNAEAEFEYWLAGSRLKDKQKQEIRDVYSKMILGISDKTINYKIGGGYNNSIGITNASKGFDAAGLVAGFLGNILRALDVYVAPPEKPDTSKTKYEGAKTIGNRGLSQLLGEAGNIQYFINLDELVDGKRGHTNRMKMLLDYINDIATEGNWDKYFTGYTPDLKEQWFKDYEKYGKNIDINNNGILDENEYLGLSKLLGLNNIEQLFYTGLTYDTPSVNSQPQVTTYNDENEYLNIFHPRSTLSLAPARMILSDKHNYDNVTRQKLVSYISSLKEDSLLELIKRSLTLPLNQRHVTEYGTFTNNYILCTSLEIARRKNILKPFSTDDNSFYVPINSDKLKTKGTGIVYKISADGKHQLLEMDRRDIPFFTESWHNDFVALIPSHKQGGTLHKFQDGGWFQKLYKLQALADWNENLSNVNWKKGTVFHGNAGDLNSVAQANANYTADLKAVGLDINKFVESFDSNLSPEEIVNLYNLNAQKIRSFWDLDVSYNTTDATPHNELFSKMFANRSVADGGNGNYNLSYQDNLKHLAGSQTWHRRMDRYEKEFADLTPEERKSRIHTITRIINGRPQVFEVYKKANGDIALYNPDLMEVRDLLAQDVTRAVANPAETSSQNTSSKGEETLPNPDEVEETALPNIEESIKTNSWQEYIPDLIGAGRLWASLYTNNRVYDAVLSALKPVLKDTYERYSPITGAFSARQFKNRQGADVMRQSNQAFTSDASLAAARMREGQRQANQLQAEGFLADDQEIKRTQNEALVRQEDNMARRSEVANFNRASINQTGRERAQLEATRLKSNWQSWDNFLQGVESRLRTKFDENRTLSNNFREQISMNSANRWHNNVMEAANRERDAWIKAETERTGKTPDITSWSKWKQYDKRRREAENMMKAMQYRDMANIYNISYTSPYTDEQYNNFIKWV